MADRHRVKPMSVRLPVDLAAWLRARAAATGKPLRRLIIEILERARDAAGDGEDVASTASIPRVPGPFQGTGRPF